MSRPEKPIDWTLVDRLLVSGCSGAEIASHFDMHPDTFYNRVNVHYGMGFTLICAERRQKGDSHLRDKQYHTAMEGNTTMLVWLGKNRLGQRDSEHKEESPNDKLISELLSEIKSLKEKVDAPKPKTDPELQRSQ